MASPTSPTHGKFANVFRQRPNGFVGTGLNDVTWGTGYSGGGSSGYFEVEIDGTGTPDTFKWRKNGGAYTETVNITGAAQTLSDSQTITFAATTGHTLGDKWAIGNLDTEACTESSAEAQITDSTKRLLNPNAIPTFTDAGGANVLITDFTRGKAIFDANVGVVTVSGNNGFIPSVGLEEVVYLIGWDLNVSVAMADASRCQQQWAEATPGPAGGSGSAEAYFIGSNAWFEAFTESQQASGQQYFLLQLFNYDPDGDQTGDHVLAWVTFPGYNVAGARLGENVKESINFQIHGIPSFVENS